MHCLNNQWIKEEYIKEIRKLFKINENEDTAYQNFKMNEKENSIPKLTGCNKSSTKKISSCKSIY